MAGFFVSIMPSLIYAALVATPRDCSRLGPLLLRALGYISAVTLCKSAMCVGQSSAALAWRTELTAHIHARYAHRGAHYHLQLLSPSVDNPDQRIATELELWSTALAALLVSGSQSAFNILFYSAQTWLIMGWQGPALILGFFLCSATITRIVASPVAALTARVQAAEGDFRAVHAALLHESEAVALSSGGAVEAAALGESFGALLLLRWRLVMQQGLLNAATFFFEYLGGVVNYAAVGIALCAGTYDDRPTEEQVLIISLHLAASRCISPYLPISP